MTGLTRIWEDAAYSDAPIAGCWWAETADTGDWPRLEADETAEVAIIGGGFTGLSAALHLAEAGVEAAVLEARHPFWGASGRNGGFCCLGGSSLGFSEMAAKFGATAARDFAVQEKAAVEFVGDLIERLGLEVDRHSEGETQLAHRPKDFAAMRRKAGHVRELYGVEPTIIPPEGLAQAGFRGPFHGAVTTPIGFALNPRKYAAGLARAAREAGARIYGESPVTAIQPLAGGGWRLRTPQASIAARRIVIATNGYSSDNLPDWMAGRYLPTQSSIVVTRPMTQDEISAQGWTSTQMCYDTRRLLHYFRLMPDGRMLFGMRGAMSHSPAGEARVKRKIRADFDAFFPAWRHVETPHYWSGFVCLTRDLLPYAGPVPGMEGAFAGFAYHGNGVSMGSYTGALLADLVQGREPARPYAAPMRQVPRRFPLGRYRRLLMPPKILQFALQDM